MTISAPTLVLGTSRYDTTAALLDGRVPVEGEQTDVRSTGFVPELFERMVRQREFDVGELGLTYYLRSLETDLENEQAPFVAIPAFPNRLFRHSCVYVNAASGIREPADLRGRTIGEFAMYGQDSGVWAKGILSDEYGFDPADSRWVIGGLDTPMAPLDFVAQPHPDTVEVTAETERALGDMLVAGEIDALFSANVPQCVQEGSPHVRRLFEDYVGAEQDWHRRTGLFPIMHTVVVRRDVLAQRPGLAAAAYRAFRDARDVARDHYLGDGRRMYQVATMLPWMSALVEDDLARLGPDWWPYGVDANRAELETYLRYHHEQGLSSRRHTVDELFVPELLDT